MTLTRRIPVRAFALLAALMLAGCQTTLDGEAKPPAEAVPLAYSPSREPLRVGLDHFAKGHHGLAERYFRDAVEQTPDNAAAWIALAAAYDHLKRFDLADRAYREAARLTGESVPYLNNRGYSYMLRGDYRRARAMFTRALRDDPANPTILNNLAILETQRR